MERHRHDQPTSSRVPHAIVRARVARPVDVSGAIVALLGALLFLLLLL